MRVSFENTSTNATRWFYNISILIVSSGLLMQCRAEPDLPTPAQKNPASPRRLPPAPSCNANGDPALSEAFQDNFDREELGPNWNLTASGAYFLRQGRVCTASPKNHPLWLKRKLPLNVRIAFEATALSTSADVKTEIFGDGCSFDRAGGNYLATSYVAVLGAHKNSEHWLARLDEHGQDVRRTVLQSTASTLASSKLTAQQTYRVELSRTNGRTLRFVVNEVEIHTFEDNQPLSGNGHDHFAFNGWDAPVCFDNLSVTPLP